MNTKNNPLSCDFKQFLDFHVINYQTAERLSGVHRTTFKRWLDGISTPPAAVVELLRLYATGEIPSHDKSWHDWKMLNGGLNCALYPRRVFLPRDILMIPCYENQARELANIKQNFALQSKLF